MFKTLNMVYKNHWKSRKLCCLKLFVNPVGRHINIIRKVRIYIECFCRFISLA